MEKLDFFEEHARANAAFQIGCADAMERQASALLNILLAGAGGALAYAVNLAEKNAALWQQSGMASTAIWLFAVAGALLLGGLWARATAMILGSVVLYSSGSISPISSDNQSTLTLQIRAKRAVKTEPFSLIASISEMVGCVMPTASASCTCVSPACFLARNRRSPYRIGANL